MTDDDMKVKLCSRVKLEYPKAKSKMAIAIHDRREARGKKLFSTGFDWKHFNRFGAAGCIFIEQSSSLSVSVVGPYYKYDLINNKHNFKKRKCTSWENTLNTISLKSPIMFVKFKKYTKQLFLTRFY